MLCVVHLKEFQYQVVLTVFWIYTSRPLTSWHIQFLPFFQPAVICLARCVTCSFLSCIRQMKMKIIFYSEAYSDLTHFYFLSVWVSLGLNRSVQALCFSCWVKIRHCYWMGTNKPEKEGVFRSVLLPSWLASSWESPCLDGPPNASSPGVHTSFPDTHPAAGFSGTYWYQLEMRTKKTVIFLCTHIILLKLHYKMILVCI